ncbi:MAG: LysR family transcriptional regulator, partial [Ruminococcaceae bacterium]|nr:LysR family transcriptional regulator [Oscillospiraceae bacterium]
VAERKSFTKAAEALLYTQSTVSAQIKQLETELDAVLFDRINHRISLTEQGRELLKYAHQLVNIVEEIKLDSGNSDDCEGVVRFAMAASICNIMMGETYLTFHKKHPNIIVKIYEGETDGMCYDLDHNDIDLAFIVDRHQYNKDYVTVFENKVMMHFVAGKDFPLAKQRHLSIEQLLEYPFFLTEKGLSYRQLLDEELAKRNIEITPQVEMGNTRLLLELVELGGGISFLPDYVTRQSFEQGNIVYLDVKDIDIELWRQLLYHKNKWVSPAMQKVIDYCASVAEHL